MGKGWSKYVSVGLAVGVLLSGWSGFVGNEVSASSKTGSGVSVKEAKPGKPGEKPAKPGKPGIRPVPKKGYKSLPIKPIPKPKPRGEVVAFGGDVTSPGFKEVTGLEKRKMALSLAITKAKAEQTKRGVTLEVVDGLQKRVDVLRGTYKYKSLSGENTLLERLDRDVYSLRSSVAKIAYPGTVEIQRATTEKQVIALELRLANTVKSVLAYEVAITRQKKDVTSHERFLDEYKLGLKKKFEGLKENGRLVGQMRTYDGLYAKYDSKIVTDQVRKVLKKRGLSVAEEDRILAGVRAELASKLVLGNMKLATREMYEKSFNNDTDTVSKRGSLLNGVVNEVVKVSQSNARVISEILKKNGVLNGDLYFDGMVVIF